MRKTKPNETKFVFMSPFTPSGNGKQTDRANSTTAGADGLLSGYFDGIMVTGDNIIQLRRVCAE